jgi:DNA excision repair protein ERCC-1
MPNEIEPDTAAAPTPQPSIGIVQEREPERELEPNRDAGAVHPPTSFLEAFGHLQKADGFAGTLPKPPAHDTPANAEPSRQQPLSHQQQQHRPQPHDEPAPVIPGNAQQHISAALVHARAKTTMLASTRQRKNPMLAHVRHVRVEFDAGIAPDFICGATTAVLYLSLQYHRVSPAYVYERVKGLGRSYRLRVLLVLADVEDSRAAVRELTKLALASELTLVCCGGEREAARYCETLRCYDAKTADSIQERVGADYPAQLRAALTSVRGINKTDVATLGFTFGSLNKVALATREELRTCPGMGERKVARLYAAMNQPFKTSEPWESSGAVGEDDDP